ncbi:MAG: hypothetical protein ACMG6S_10665 [Byssovorax sp.]
MALEVVFVVGLLVLGALFALAVEVVGLRGRAWRLEQDAATQAHALAAVQSRLAELGREEQTRPEGISTLLATPEGQLAQGAEPAALAEGEQTESGRPTALPTTPGDAADYSELVAATAADDAAGDADDNADDDAQTQVLLTTEMQTALGAGAGGATRPPQATPRAVRPVVVAPPASAPPLPSAEAAIKAAGLGRRPQSGPVAPLQRTETLLGMPAVRPQEPDDAAAPRGAIPYVSKTLLSMPAQGAAATSSPSDSAELLPDQVDTRRTFESLPLFDLELSNAPGVEQEAAE